MAQTGFTPISNYYSATATNVPTAGNLVAGELAINTADGKLFYKDSSGVVQTMASKATTAGTYSSITTSNLTIGTTQLGAGDASIMKNRIINGAMVIDQRNAGAQYSTSTLASANFYCLDRYLISGTQNSKFTIQQNAGSITAPLGFNNYLGCTSSSAYTVAAGDLFAIIQRIEAFNTSDLGWGTANAKTVTLSFWVYSSLTGTFSGSLRNYNNNRSYPYTYSIPIANTWTQISVTIAGDTSGTWEGATNNVGISVQWSLGTGSTYSGTAGAWASANYYAATGATSVVGTSGATFYITGVQLEVGSSATGFEYRQYGQELSLCQRYYYRAYPASGNSWAATGYCNNTTVATYRLMSKVTMRTTPSALEQSGTATDYAVQSSVGVTTCSSVPVFDNSSPDALGFQFTVALGLVAGGATLARAASANGYLGWSAEL